MVRRFLASGRTGFYFAVTREGEVGAGDEIKEISREANAVPVSAITRLYIAKRYGEDDVALVRRALRVAALPDSWKEYFRERLGKARVLARLFYVHDFGKRGSFRQRYYSFHGLLLPPLNRTAP